MINLHSTRKVSRVTPNPAFLLKHPLLDIVYASTECIHAEGCGEVVTLALDSKETSLFSESFFLFLFHFYYFYIYSNFSGSRQFHPTFFKNYKHVFLLNFLLASYPSSPSS